MPEGSQRERPSKLQISLWFALTLLVAILSLRGWNSFQVGTYVDDSSYVVLAESLVHSSSYGLAFAAGNTTPTNWPFGFPLILAPFTVLAADQPASLQLISLAATVVIGALIFWGWPVLTGIKSYWLSLTVAALSILSPLAMDHTRMVMSEPSFTALVILTLILVEQQIADDRRGWARLWLIGLLATHIIFVRSIGIALFGATFIRLVLQRSISKSVRHVLGFTVGSITFLGFVLLCTPVTFSDMIPVVYLQTVAQHVESTASEEAPFITPQANIPAGVIAGRLDAALEYVTNGFRAVMIPGGGGQTEQQLNEQLGTNLSTVLNWLVALLVITGAGVSIATRQLKVGPLLFCAAYFGGLLFWPWQLSRFLYPLLSFLYYFFLRGIKSILHIPAILLPDMRTRALPRYLLAICSAVLLLLALVKDLPIVDSRDHVRDFRIGSDWLRENSPAQALVMAQQPQTIYLYSGRHTVDYPQTTALADLVAYLQETGVDYIMVAPQLRWQAERRLTLDSYSRNVMLPMLVALEQSGEVRLAYESDLELVWIYDVLLH